MRARHWLYALLIAVAAGPTDAAAQSSVLHDWRDDVAGAARALVEAGVTPALGVAVTIGDRVVYADGFGVADAGSGRSATGDTPFYIASTTKSLTALAAAIAAERGDLELDAPMVRYLPDAWLPDGVPRHAITVRHLITLTHGLSGNGPVVIRTAFTGDFTKDQLLRLLAEHESTRPLGQFAYDNLGYNLLGMVLEAVYEEPWQDVVRRLVETPVGMVATSARLSTLDRDDIAQPHVLTLDGWRRVDLAKDDANMHAAGAHFSSARDLGRYLAAHIGGGMVEGVRVLPEAPVRATHRLHTAQDREFGPYHRHGWGFGWDIGTYGADTLVHRFGSFEGYRSHVSFMPQHDIGVVVLVNGDGPASPASDLLAMRIYDLLLAKPDAQATFEARLDSLTARAAGYRVDLTEHLAERAERQQPLAHPLEYFAGVYENEQFGRTEWRLVAGALEVRAGVARSRAEVYDAASDAMRIELFGSGQVADFDFPSGGGPANGFTLAERRFRRVQ